MAKKVLYKIEREDKSITLKDIVKMIEKIQKDNPELEVFFDGDDFAICSRPKKDKDAEKGRGKK